MAAGKNSETAAMSPLTGQFIALLGSFGYQSFKGLVYLLLFSNVFLFLSKEYAASQHLFSNGFALGQIVQGFAASIDTAAWFLLLMMFELETYQIPDRRLTPRVSATLRILRTFSYSVIGYAFFGYLTKALAFVATPAPVSDACLLVDGVRSLMVRLDEFVPLTAGSCTTVTQPLLLAGTPVVVAADTYSLSLRLAWLDVTNSGSWLVIVALLELDVWLQRTGRLSGMIYGLSSGAKVVLYAVLFAAAVYWGVAGDFLDFWDASLWLLAFFLIEMNVFQWRAESRDPLAAETA